MEMHGLDEYDSKARNYYPAIGRTLTIDPLCEKYYWISPYAWCGGNPVRLIDPNGKEVFITGEDAKIAARVLDKSSSLKIKIDKKTGQLSATGEVKTDYDKKLLASINDKNIKVTLNTTNSNTTERGNNLYIGAFGGNKVNSEGKVEAKATINMNHVQKAANLYGTSRGSYVGHEIVESYIAGKDSPNTPAPTMNPNSKGYNEYLKAHNEAMSIDPSYVAPNIFTNSDCNVFGLERFYPGTQNVSGEVILYTK